MFHEIVKWKDNSSNYPVLENPEQMRLLNQMRTPQGMELFVRVSGENAESFSNDGKIELFTRVNDSINTGNWLGVVGCSDNAGNSLRVEISSRFDAGEKQYFLLYLLSNVYGFNLYKTEIESSADTAFDVILCALFLERLKEAYGDGLYKVYKNKRHNDFDFKGSFDVARHIRLNTPFMGKTAYTTREYTYDNDLLCMIRQTMDYVKNKYPDLWESYVKQNVIWNEIESVIEETTPSFQMNVRYENRKLCQSPVNHPLLQKYESVRILCQRISQESGDNIYEIRDERSSALLIDISWLWEEFVATKLLNQSNYAHVLTKGGRSRDGLHFSKDKSTTWYPDFLEKDSADSNRRNVLDAKYKYWDYKREDMHQFLAYLYLTGGEGCGAIYPVQQGEGKNAAVDRIRLNPFEEFYGKEVYCYKLPLEIPFYQEDDSYDAFYEKMEENIRKWKEQAQKEGIIFRK